MKNSFYISFGAWITILPLLGIPGVWRNGLISLSGLFLVLIAFGPTILKKLQTKPKLKKRKEEVRFSEDSPNLTHPPTPSLKLREGKSETATNSPLN